MIKAKTIPKSKFSIVLRRFWALYLIALPILAYYLLLRFYPMAVQLILSIKDYKILAGIWGSPWVGLDNFKDALVQADFFTILKNTLVISVLKIAAGFLPSLLLAIFLFDLKNEVLKNVSQTLIYIPYFLSWVVVYGVFYVMFSNLGFVNQMLKLLGGTEINFLLSTEWILPLLIGSELWKHVGFGTIIYMAGLSTINPAQYEAARIDGAGPISRIFYISIPGLAPIIVFIFTLSLGRILYAGSEQILLFYSPATYSVADILDTWVYRHGLQNLQYSMTSAVTFFQSALGMCLVILSNKLSIKWTGVGIW